MAAGNWTIVNDFKAYLLKKKMDLSADTFKVGLAASSSNLATTLTPSAYSNVTGELSTANGYTAGGTAAGSPTVTGGGATSTITFDTANVSWTASGGSLVARYAFIYDDSSTPKQVMAYCLLDSTPADVTVVNGDTLTISIVNVFSLS